MHFDLHVHTELSPCGAMSIDQIIACGRRLGLDGVCITDHHTMAARHQITEGLQPDGLCVLIGMEYATADGDFLLFGPFEDLAPGLSARQLLELVPQHSGAAVGAHPFRSSRPMQEYIVREKLCRIVEGINGRNSMSENMAVDTWQHRYELTLCGGSDAHLVGELGRMVTFFERPVRSRHELIDALQQGVCYPEQLAPSCRCASLYGGYPTYHCGF